MKYTTKKGDTFDSIAYSLYGDEEQIAPLIKSNPEYVETAVFDYGVQLEIPEIKKTDSSIYLPPWRSDNVNS